MIVVVCSAKGSPGVTSTALTLAAVWSRPVVLLEADPTGGDLALRCRAHGGGPVAEAPNVLGLAAAARSSQPGSLSKYTQFLASGVSVIQGVTSLAQGRGLAGLWAPIAQVCRDVDIDIVVDLGRLDSVAPVMAMVTVADPGIDCVHGVAGIGAAHPRTGGRTRQHRRSQRAQAGDALGDRSGQACASGSGRR